MQFIAKAAIYLIVGLCLLSVACQQKSDQNEVDSIKIGALFPLSGDLKDKGIDSINGILLAAEDINAAGGIQSLGGARLEITTADTRGRPDIGISETRRLIKNEGVAAIVGTYQSSVTKPATRVAEQLKTPFVVSISVANIITERGFRYTFRIQPKATFYARDQVRFLKNLQRLAGYHVGRVALLHENTDFGTSTALAQKVALRKHGMEVVADVSYRAAGVTTLKTEVSRVLTAKPDVILTVTYLADSLLIRRAMLEAGVGIPLVDTAGGAVSPEYIQALGSGAEGVLTVAEFSKFAAGGKMLNRRFRERYGTDITGDSAHAYQALLVLKDALERCGGVEKDRLRNALSATDIQKGPNLVLPASRLRFDKSGQNEFAQLFVVQIQDGEWVPVWPETYAAAALRLGWAAAP